MKNYRIDMCNGPLFKNMAAFTVPLILTCILQLLFNAADTVVVGKFSGERALAAVGSTTSLVNLLLNLVIGLSMGAGVVVARNYGAGNKINTRNSIRTSIAVALISGGVMLGAGLILAKPLLRIMGTPENIIDLSALYMHIYFLGMPTILLYNFGSSMLRAAGDTKRPLYILMGAGVVNIILNLILVIVFNLGVVGVAVATIVSETISAYFVIKILVKSEGMLHLDLRKIKIHRKSLVEIIKIGLPAGMQGVLFNISNVLIQSSVNSFGYMVIAGNTAAVTIEGFIYTSTNALCQTSMNFTSQNLGARKYKRIDFVVLYSVLSTVVAGAVLGTIVYLFGESILKICVSNEEAISYGLIRLGIVGISYSLCGVMDVTVSCLRGLGFSLLPTLVCLLGACVFRIVWIFTVFKNHHTLSVLYMSYPISWTISGTVLILGYLYVRKKIFR